MCLGLLVDHAERCAAHAEADDDLDQDVGHNEDDGDTGVDRAVGGSGGSDERMDAARDNGAGAGREEESVGVREDGPRSG